MAVNAWHGRLGSFYITTGTTSAAQDEVAQIDGWSLRITRPGIDVTNNDSSGWAERLTGIGDWEGTVNIVFGSTSAGNETVRTALATPVNINCIFRPTTESTGGLWRGTGLISGYDITGETPDAFKVVATVQAQSGLTYSTST